jgi:hypothetical protein
MCSAAAEGAKTDRYDDPSFGELGGKRVEHRRKVAARGRPDRHNPGEALHIVGVPSVVPKQPATVRRPPRGLCDEIAAVGPNQKVRSGYRVEHAADALSRTPVIQDHDVRDQVSMANVHAASVANILHGLVQAGRGEAPLWCVPPRQRQ